MKRSLLLTLGVLMYTQLTAQAPRSYSSADILQQIKKLDVFGSVLYIAAHPDDENTRLLAYLANERKLRTGYLSITRGDGGQNLIGDEQGIDLGLIRTQELLAARRIDGAEQFFTRAYDFGFSKSPDETMRTWGHDKILSDVVWVIRNFKPDVIITRFPTTGEGGHGHHTASAILAGEAFDAAADPAKFPEQLSASVTTWKVRRLLWNTFNFGGNNTTRDDQFKIDVGMYNPILGKSYGELAAESRSQHKSQGFGVPAQRGESFEYFSTIKGDKPQRDLMDGIDITSARISIATYQQLTESLSSGFKPAQPAASLNSLLKLHTLLKTARSDYWVDQKLIAVKGLVEAASGIFMEATASSPYAVIGDTLKGIFSFNNRTGVPVTAATATYDGRDYTLSATGINSNSVVPFAILVSSTTLPTQPYWLEKEMSPGSFNVADQKLIGKAEVAHPLVTFTINIAGEEFQFDKPVRYKYTDPVKGELYQPIAMVPSVTMSVQPALTLIAPALVPQGTYAKNVRLFIDGARIDSTSDLFASIRNLKKGQSATVLSRVDPAQHVRVQGGANQMFEIPVKDKRGSTYVELREINYDHIPAIRYFKPAVEKVLLADVKIAGKNIGYINGAGDKVPAALEQMGYTVTFLNENDITATHLRQFDAVVTGVRAYNTNSWLGDVYERLMTYVKDGGVLVVQYNTNSGLGPLQSRMAPFPFTVSRSRVTDENAAVTFLLPGHPVLNYPNKITPGDFEGWIQERSIYNAESIDKNYQKILGMKDPGENQQEGSLIVANHGKGKFVYTGLVFFRELPAGVAGAFRLFANLLAAPKPASKGDPQKAK